MKAYLPLENYIKKQELDYGVGLLITTSEEKAKSMTSRKKNVCSYNQWLEADIPEQHVLLNVNQPLYMHSQNILDGLKQEDFILTLFITEARKFFMQNPEKEDFEKKIKELKEDKLQILTRMTGLELVQFVNSRCKNHDMGKTSALLYQANIKGAFIPNGHDTDILIFNPHKDLINVNPKSEMLSTAKVII